MTNYPEKLSKYYRIIQTHAEKVAKRQYDLQLEEHLKKGRKKSTFKFNPTRVQQHLIKLSSDVLGGKASVEDAMSYIAHDYDFQKERYG
jgi:hypothetical protein